MGEKKAVKRVMGGGGKKAREMAGRTNVWGEKSVRAGMRRKRGDGD